MQALPTLLDTSALSEHPSRQEARRSWRALVAQHPEARDTAGLIRRWVLAVPTFGSGIGFLALALLLTAEVAMGKTGIDVAIIVQVVLGGLILFPGVLCGWAFIRVYRRRPKPRVHHRLMRFAAANGMSYRPGPTRAARDSPFRRRGALNLYHVLATPGDRGTEFANYEIARPVTANTAPAFGGYVALRLPVPLPNIVLRSLDGPKRPLHTSSVLREDQRLPLEGDFDRFFHLYCPEGYERDALYLFTPDVMARLVDHVRGLDVEIDEDWMFLISARDLVIDDPGRWTALADAVDALDDRIERWGSWRDERLARGEQVGPALGGGGVESGPTKVRAASVAKRGRRLRTTWGLGTILIVGSVSLFFVALIVALNLL